MSNHLNEPEQSEDTSPESLIADVADEFTERVARGERPEIEEYARRHPALADVIRRLLPALQVMRLPASESDINLTSPSLASPALDLIGTLGDYRLTREVGRGGMGVVYEALQISLGRKVALKVLPFAAALDPKQLQRFKTEAQSASHLHHNSIVPVYGIGCERGVHYYAMQFIEGQSLDALLDELRRGRSSEPAEQPAIGQPDAPTRPLAGALAATIRSTTSSNYFRSVAQWGIQAAEALEHAHQLGVVHRDIKPGNLIVDVQGHLWVTDFGLARWQSEAGLTMTGDLVGTFRYMSPEQALGRRAEVDQGTDIYALGATLYELLTLEPVFSGNDRQELLHRIASDEPTLPTRLRKEIPPELETIVLKCLEKQREARYRTAGALAEDLRRFLDDRPILARKPNVVERAARWARRHRTVVGSAVALLFLAVVGLTISTVLISAEQARTKTAYALLAQEQSRTRAAYESEARQRQEAEVNFRQARQEVDFFTRLSEAELRDKPETRRKFLEAALGYYQAFIEQQHDNPAVRDELVAGHEQVAAILTKIGQPADAQAAFKFLQGSGQLKLLGQDSVQAELKMSPEQARKIAELASRRAELLRDFRGWGPDSWLARAQKIAPVEQAAIELLQSEQAKRLQQIVLQTRGPQAFGDSEVADALQLTAEQRDRVRLIQEDRRSVGGPPFGPGGGGFMPGGGPRADWSPPWGGGFRPNVKPLPSDGKKPAELPADELLLNLLTAPQKKKWQEMLGEPFRGEIHGNSTVGPPWSDSRFEKR